MSSGTHAQALSNDDALLCPPMRSWIDNSLFAKLSAHHDTMMNIPRLRDAYTQRQIQRYVHDKLFEDPVVLAKAVASILDRARYWHRKFHIQHHRLFVEHLVKNLRLISRCLPPFAAFNVLRTIGNAWPTGARVGRIYSPCLFGCGGVDSLLHYCECPSVILAAKSLLPMVGAHVEDPLFLLCLVPFNSGIPNDKPLVFAAGLLADAVFVARAEAIHSGRTPCLRTSILGRFRQIARASDRARGCILRVCGLLGGDP